MTDSGFRTDILARKTGTGHSEPCYKFHIKPKGVVQENATIAEILPQRKKNRSAGVRLRSDGSFMSA